PRARFSAFAVAANDPVIMLTAPLPATTKILEKTSMRLDDFDLIEINEAFASVVLAWEREFHPDMSKVNVNGGAIAIGHPPACSGTELDEVELSRRGRVWSYTDNRYPPPPPAIASEPFEPYAVAAVELATEQMVVLGQVVRGADTADLSAGMEMELALETLY